MSDGTGTTLYCFIPALRRGLTAEIDQKFGEWQEADTPRASFTVKLNLAAQPQALPDAELPTKDVALYGPGDILGFDPRIVVRTAPADTIGDFEPNYFPFIEFSEPDFPWRYTPAKLVTDTGTGSLNPWLSLVVLIAEDVPDRNGVLGREKEVLEEGLFEDAEESRKIPWVKVKTGSLPKLEEAWHWAHVQVVASDRLGTGGCNVGNELSARLPELLRNQPERALSRLLCPRRLRPDVKYFAYVVPTFKYGVEAALGPSALQGDTQSVFAWPDDAADVEIQLPYYYKWEFRTGLRGDYEHLVRLLEPRPLTGLGVADVDCQNPGYDLLDELERSDLDPQHEAYHALEFESALKSVDTNFTPWGRDGNAADTNEFRKLLSQKLNRANAYLTLDEGIDEEAPMVGPPIYGHWHAQRATVEHQGTNVKGWLDELNLDPRHRAAAGVGAEVVKGQQEQLMASAWDQLGDIEKVNDILRRAQLGRELSTKVKQRLRSLPLGDFLRFTTPLHGRMKAAGSQFTVRKQVRDSRIGRAPVDSALRRIARKRGALRKRQMYQGNVGRPDMLTRLNDAQLRVVDRFIPSRGMATIESITRRLDAALTPNIVGQPEIGMVSGEFEYTFANGTGPLGTTPKIEVIGGEGWLVLTDNLNGTATLKGTPPAPQIPANHWFGKTMKYPIQLRISEAGGNRVFEQSFTVVAVQKKTLQPEQIMDSRVAAETKTPSVDTMESRLTTRVTEVQPWSIGHEAEVVDSRWFAARNITMDVILKVVGKFPVHDPRYRFGHAITEGFEGWLDTSKAVPDTRDPLTDMVELRRGITTRIDPQKTIVERSVKRFHLRYANPAERQQRWVPGRELDPIIVAPEFPQPMCEALEEISQDLLLRGIEKVPQNTVALLETNRRFIEAFMCGLNHEFSGELLWREYPGDLRGSSFRQFWRTEDFMPEANQIRSYRDAMGIDQWSEEYKTQFAELYRDQLGDARGLSDADVFESLVTLKAIEEVCKDVPPIVTWKADRLGTNYNDLQNEQKLVLLIRGDLLKKYPNTVIYAVKGTAAGLPNLPEYTSNTGEIRTPIFRGAAKPDITFLGFDFTAYEARTENWFIVLEERCSELRFGLDIDQSEEDLAWSDFGLSDEYDAYIDEIGPNGSETEWNKSAASIALMTMQNPVRIVIDANQLLPKEEALFELKNIDTGDTFVIKLVRSDVIKHARDILRGIESEKTLVMGKIVKEQASYNPNWSYHLDPESVEFYKRVPAFSCANMLYVEQHLDEVGSTFLANNHWCPQGVKLFQEQLS